MNNWTARALLLAVGITCATLARAEDATPSYAVTKTFTIGGEGGWDYAIVDPATHYLYTTRQTHTQVIDTATGKLIADIPKCGAHGIALVPNLNKGFTSDGKADTVTAFDLKSNTVLYTLPTGHNPDCIIYDPANQKLFAFDGKSNDVTVIKPDAPAKDAVIGHIPLDGKPEFAVSDGAGHVYVNIEDKNEIQVIDTQSLAPPTNTWKIDGEGPSGLAIDIANHHLFVGCDSKMVIVDCTTGKTIATTPIGDGVDACAFDPETHETFASCGDGTLAVIKETSPGKFETLQTVTTKPGARTMALDAGTHTIYLSTAEYLPKAEGEKRAKMKPDTFQVLVVAPK